jgi:penicillin-binding protein 2
MRFGGGRPYAPEPATSSRRARTIAFACGIAAVFAVLIWQLAGVQLRDGSRYSRLADLNQLRTIPVAAPRGVIYDRHGVVIARNRPSFVVQVVPMQLVQPQAEIQELATILGKPASDIWKRLLHQNGVVYKSFADLANAVPLGPINVADDLNPQVVGRFAEQADHLPGMAVELIPVRDYPFGTIGSHIVGYVGQITASEYAARKSKGYGSNDVVGKDGIEFQYDRLLQGQRGGRRIKVNSAGEAVANVDEFVAVPGDSLDLTVDWRLQRAAETAVALQRRDITKRIGHAVAGAAIVVDPNTGAVLALVSQPNINPDDFSTGITEARYASYLHDPLNPLFDRAISGKYPTGSTFKMISGSAILASGLMSPTSTKYCGGAFDLNGFIFNDDRSGGHGTLDVRTAVAESCDVFFYQVGHELGIDRLDKYASAFGIGQKTGIDLPGETEGTLPTPAWKKQVVGDDWYGGDTVNMAIGQGFVEASPVQMLRVASAVANGGKLITPFIVADARNARGKIVQTFSPPEPREVPVPAEDLAVIRAGMLGAIEDPGGTAHNVEIPGFHYAGKTGTAENSATIDNPEGYNHTWFVCFAPYVHPQIAVVVFMDQTNGFGAVNAAPVAQAIVEAYFHIHPAGPNGSGLRD